MAVSGAVVDAAMVAARLGEAADVRVSTTPAVAGSAVGPPCEGGAAAATRGEPRR
jgi:hypothetical protein